MLLCMEGWGQRAPAGCQWEHPTGLRHRGYREQLHPHQAPGGEW